jgi:hypothetical protein
MTTDPPHIGDDTLVIEQRRVPCLSHLGGPVARRGGAAGRQVRLTTLLLAASKENARVRRNLLLDSVASLWAPIVFQCLQC